MSHRRSRITIKDIAKRLDVSTTTVSRALADKPDISPEMKHRVLEASKQMGYVKSALGRGLVTGHSGAIGCVIRAHTDAFGAGILEGVEDVAIGSGLTLMVASSHMDVEREIAAIDEFDAYGVAGILVLCSQIHPETASRLSRLRPPTVFVSSDEPSAGAKSVRVDDYAGARVAVSHLIELGHHRIAHISVRRNLSTQRQASSAEQLTLESQQRYAGYQQALADHGLAFDPGLVMVVEDSEKGGAEGAGRLLELEPRPTAVFCFADRVAFGAISVFNQVGIRIPHNLSIVGFDDLPMAVWMSPPLTTVHQPLRDMGRTAMEMVLAMLAGKQCPDKVVLPCELMIRGSTAPSCLREGDTT